MKLYSIKPLEWECQSPTVWKAKTSIFDYYIYRKTDGFESIATGVAGVFWAVFCKEWDEAKQKAQEHWNNRISQYLTEYKEGK